MIDHEKFQAIVLKYRYRSNLVWIFLSISHLENII